MQGEHDPLVDRQPPEPAFELVPVGDRQEVVGRRPVRRSAAPEGWRRDAVPGVAWRMQTLMSEPLQPGVESVRIAEPPQVTPGDHQRVLEGILGPIDVVEDPLRDREQAVDPRPDQVDIRLPVATLGRLDEIAIHCLGLWGGALRGRRPTLLVRVWRPGFTVRWRNGGP